MYASIRQTFNSTEGLQAKKNNFIFCNTQVSIKYYIIQRGTITEQ